MAIVYPKKNVMVPVMIIDGYLPSKEKMINFALLAKEFNSYNIDYIVDPIACFKEITNMIQSQISSIGENEYNHFVFSPNNITNNHDNQSRKPNPLEILLRSNEVIAEINNDLNYCINILANPFTECPNELTTYASLWMNSLGFVSKNDSKYLNYKKFCSDCTAAIGYIQDLYNQPISKYLNEIANKVGYSFHRVSFST